MPAWSTGRPPGRPRSAARPRREDDDRRRANRLRAGRWCPAAAPTAFPGCGCAVAGSQEGAAGWAPGPGAGPAGGERWIRRVIGADRRSARHTGWTGWASCTYADSARAGNGGRCPHRAGPSGPLACMRSRRKPGPHPATARSRMRHSRSRRAWLPRRMTAGAVSLAHMPM
jgi:hypothetical protein